MLLQETKRMARMDIPELYTFIMASADQYIAIWMKGERTNQVLMSAQDVYTLSG
jgi:hypothetical protein